MINLISPISENAHIIPALLLSAVIGMTLIPSGAASGGESGSTGSFYAGKTVTLFVGFRPGAAYDLYARLASRHLVRHIPGAPAIVIENSAEPATVTAQRIYRAAPDGTVLSALIPALYLTQLTGSREPGFDLAKFTWIGTPTKSHYLLYMRTDAPYKTMRDIRDSSVAPVCGAGEITTTGYYLPRLFEETLGTKFKIVSGFKEGPDVDSAVQRGELQCRALTIDGFFSHEPYPTWLKSGFVRVLLQTGAKRDPRLPNVPTIHELMDEYKTADDNRRLAKLVLASSQFGRPIVAPPGVPANRVELLRGAYNKAMKDPALIAEAKRDHLEINPGTGQELDSLAKDVVAQPKDIVERMKKLLGK
jgi:tripartite-type tricarboxylate transporter receptor subunit TctC